MMRKRTVALFLAVAGLVAFVAGRALAYVTTSPYKLSGGVYGRSYYIGADEALKPDVRAGVTSWNSDPTTPVWYNTEQSLSGATLDFFFGNYGNTGWCGIAYYVDSSGLTINPGGYPNQNWSRNYTQIQYPKPANCGAYTWQSISAHEMGHAMGLKHSLDTTALMYEYYFQQGTITPKGDDSNGINSLYP